LVRGGEESAPAPQAARSRRVPVAATVGRRKEAAVAVRARGAEKSMVTDVLWKLWRRRK
jgi:hypothetical protein